MMISTRGRYALRILLDLAQHKGAGYVPMKFVAERQGLSLKYIEGILPALVKNKLVEGIKGRGGGYKLTREPEQYKVGEILRLTDGNLAPVTCLECGAKPCSRAATCPTLPMWTEFHQMANNFFDGVTIADLLKNCK